ncbi:TolB family protein [Aspergillus udagawae]|uniref:Saponin hydrolase n=1 Tax=Aspergillus udagawae TaxID=91492 RepID=A0A8E0UX79_9EURO|nr:uncharacterized protein Aud_000053 [Aspergillus udagawae]GIC84239.1 hypothetical protein Aud_000053 [Aspergillus udagawae]
MKSNIAVLAIATFLCRARALPPPPLPEAIEVVELPLPPVAPTDYEGACAESINPHRTGCISQISNVFQAGDFTPDGNHVLANVEFVGAPASPDPASVYIGQQLIVVKTDGSLFPNGDPWKCLSCGVPAIQAQSLNPERDYPHAARNGRQALWGNNILDCGGALLVSDECNPNKTYIYPIYWPTSTNTTAPSGSVREMRMHPDDVHVGWSSFTAGGENTYFGRLQFNDNPTTGDPRVPRYDLVNVNLLADPRSPAPIMAEGNRLKLHDDSILAGELRGFSGTGDEILYVGPTREANNIDIFAVHVATGVVRRLTRHPEYADPIAFSHDNQWFVTMDTRGSNRQMWMAGMRYVPPLIDLVATTAAASTRNNGARRFFQPILIDRFGDRGTYFGQRINAAGDGTNGSVNDPNWNGRADPAFSPDGTRIVFWQALVIPPACGGENPLACPASTAQGGRTYRLMLARLTSRQPTAPATVYRAPDKIPWATPFPPGATIPARYQVPAGNYTLFGKTTGLAHVRLTAYPGLGGLKAVDVNYTNYSDDGQHFIHGYESVTLTLSTSNPWLNKLDWYSGLTQTGAVNASKLTGPGGFHLSIDALTNILEANGTLTTTIDGVIYTQPANGT